MADKRTAVKVYSINKAKLRKAIKELRDLADSLDDPIEDKKAVGCFFRQHNKTGFVFFMDLPLTDGDTFTYSGGKLYKR